MPRLGRTARVVAALAVAVATSLAAPAAARAVWFGAPNLDLPANVGFTCAGYPLFGLYPTGATSCTWQTVAALGELDPLRSNIVPKGIGFITAFRVRTGVGSGPMQLTILKSLRSVRTGAETTCCVGDDQGPVVTPPADAVTTFPLDRPIPVYNGPESNDIESFDSIAISLLDLTSSIPVNYDASAYVTGSALYPLVAPGEERFGQGIVVNPYSGGLNLPTGELATHGFQVLLQAEWEPAAGVKAAASSVRVRNGAALVPLTCVLGENCTGVLRFQNIRPKGAVAAATVTYGTGLFTIASGQKQSVKVTLSRAGRRLLAQHRRARVWANATFALHARKVTQAMPLTLRR